MDPHNNLLEEDEDDALAQAITASLAIQGEDKARLLIEQSEEVDNSSKQPTTTEPLTTSSESLDSNVTANEPALFYEYELRNTFNIVTRPYDRLNGLKTWRIRDIIGPKEDVEFAILSSFCWEPGWVYSFFDPKTPVIRVKQPGEDGKSGVKAEVPNWIATWPFLKDGRGCMHIKLMLIFSKSGRLRLAISTANFQEYEWRFLENAAFVQDFPPLTGPVIGKNEVASQFSSTLSMILMGLNVPVALSMMMKEHPNLPIKDVQEMGEKWDFSSAKVKLVPSMAGKHEGWESVLKQGHMSLMKEVTDIGAHADQTKRKHKGNMQLNLECQGSSVGNYTMDWLNEFYSSASGISSEKRFNKWKFSRLKAPFPPIKVLFPSRQTVEASATGKPFGVNVCCYEHHWSGISYPRELYHDSNSKRGAVLMHTKMILGLWEPKAARPNAPEASVSTIKPTIPKGGKEAVVDGSTAKDENQDVQLVEPYAAGWLYLGSHNFTPSAWGRLSDNSSTPIIDITNYELGVLIPLPDDPAKAQEQGNEMACWARPPRKYNLSGQSSDEPWMHDKWKREVGL